MKSRTPLAIVVLFALSLLVACAPKDEVSTVAPRAKCPKLDARACPNDAVATQLTVDHCDESADDPRCGNAFNAYTNCFAANAACASNGKTDTARANAACAGQNEAYQRCLAVPDGGAGD